MKVLKILLIVFGAVILLVGIALVIISFVSRNNIMDGPGMVYDFRESVLAGTWHEIGLPADYEHTPGELVLTKSNIEDKTLKQKKVCSYNIEVSDEFTEVKINPEGESNFEYLVWHKEVVDGVDVEIISGIVTELDGRGPIVVEEFAKDNIDAFPPSYRSEYASKLNDREPDPTYIVTEVRELAKLLSCVGKTAEEAEIDEGCVKHDVLIEAELYGALFQKDAVAHVFFDEGEDGVLTVKNVYLQTEKLSFDEAKEALAAEYGEPIAEGDEPYVESNGGAVIWARFEKDGVKFTLKAASNYSYISIET